MTPYTYLIGWSHHRKYYYGVRYAKNCHPSDLWTKYKTSSKYVKEACNVWGEPNVVQVRKVFTTRIEAMNWEYRVLKRLQVIKNSQWINKTDNAAIDYTTSKRRTGPGRKAALEAITGKTYEQIHGEEKAAQLKQVRSKQAKARWEDRDLRRRMSTKPKDTSKYRDAALRRWSDPERKHQAAEKMKDIWKLRNNNL